jgi:hypothetical protein
MKADYLDLTIVLDKSGSMGSLVNDTVNGFDHFVSEQKKVAGECKLTVIQFDTTYTIMHHGCDIHKVPSIKGSYQPGGSTALLDAVGKAINEAGNRFKNMSESERPAKVLFVIITDGEENSSHEFSKVKIKEMITHQRENYKWDFIYLGANVDAFSEASSMGIGGQFAANYAHTGKGIIRSYDCMSKNVVSYRAMGATGQSLGWSDDDRDALAGEGDKDSPKNPVDEKGQS